MAYLTREALEAMGFAALGRNVRISDKASLYEPEKMQLGDNTRIDDFCVVSGRIVTGRNVHIAPLCVVAGGTPGIVFGDFAGLAYGVKVFSQSDDYSGATLTNPTVPAIYKAERKAPIILGRHVIVGANAVVAPGVELGEGAAVGAGAVVLRSCAPWTILTGVPACATKRRARELLEKEQILLRDEAEQQAKGSSA